MAFLAPFVFRHLDDMEIKDGDASSVAAFPDVADTLSRLGAKTIFADDKKTILGIIGCAPSVPGVGEVFILASKQQVKHPIAFARCIHRELSHLCSEYRRIQAVTNGDATHRRFVKWLGFSEEGVLRKYGLRGEDMTMWSLV